MSQALKRQFLIVYLTWSLKLDAGVLPIIKPCSSYVSIILCYLMIFASNDSSNRLLNSPHCMIRAHYIVYSVVSDRGRRSSLLWKDQNETSSASRTLIRTSLCRTCKAQACPLLSLLAVSPDWFKPIQALISVYTS